MKIANESFYFSTEEAGVTFSLDTTRSLLEKWLAKHPEDVKLAIELGIYVLNYNEKE